MVHLRSELNEVMIDTLQHMDSKVCLFYLRNSVIDRFGKDKTGWVRLSRIELRAGWAPCHDK